MITTNDAFFFYTIFSVGLFHGGNGQGVFRAGPGLAAGERLQVRLGKTENRRQKLETTEMIDIKKHKQRLKISFDLKTNVC